MSLIKRSNFISPFTNTFLTDFFNNDRFLNNELLLAEKMPAVNIEETDLMYMLEIAVPGMKKDEFVVDVADGMLTISAEHKEEAEKKDKNYTRKEFNYESFSRMFALPENIKEKEIDAEYKEGILYVKVPKKEVAVAPKRSVAVK